MERADLKNLVVIGLLILAIGLIGWNGLGMIGWKGVSGLQAEAGKLKADRTKLETSVKSAQMMVGNLDKIRKERETLEAQLREISRRLPSERESAEVLRSVESLAGKSGLTLAAIKRRAVRTQELYAELPMEVGVSGGYHELVRFADQLSQLDRLVTLSEFQVLRPGPTPGQPASRVAPGGTVKAQMVAVVFQALPEPAAPAPGAPAAGAPAAPARK
ncbi:MAG: type 4a pilus biogenesis protein PilO [Candidatus Rokubacteria bacterium]|nr:type 4a pilus biogenesis protein PilO [Candidatus Rokubacteria bacterium]